MFHEQPVKILVLDDEERIRITLSDVLKTQGYSVTCVGTGQEAIDYIREDSYNIAVVATRLFQKMSETKKHLICKRF